MNNPVVIRRARYRDVKSIFRIHLDSLGGLDEEDYEWFAGLLKIKSRRRKVLVAEYNGEIAGFIIAYKYRDRAYIDSLAVDKKFRGLGIGRRLLESLEKILLEEGVETISLSVKKDNYNALGFYIKQGYVVKGVVLLLTANISDIKNVDRELNRYDVVVKKACTNDYRISKKVLTTTWWSNLTEPVDARIYRKLYDNEYVLLVYKNNKLRGIAEFYPEKKMTIDYLAVSYHKPTSSLSTLLSALKNECIKKGIEEISIQIDSTKSALIKRMLEHGFRINSAEYKLIKELD